MTKIKALLKKIELYERQRKIWMVFSIFFVAFLLSIAFEWRLLLSTNRYEILALVLGILVTTGVIWWYWTMAIVKNLLTERKAELELLLDITNDIKTIKTDILKKE